MCYNASMDQTVLAKAYYVYIVYCVDGTLYTGYTTDVKRRMRMHNVGKGGHYTRSHRPVTLAALWVFPTKSEALQMECQIKRLSRAQKLPLVGHGIEITS